MMKPKLQDYTESEFKALIQLGYDAELSEEDADELVYFFSDIIQHPDHEDLLSYPSDCGIDDSPEAIIAELKRWYAENGLPCFKQD